MQPYPHRGEPERIVVEGTVGSDGSTAADQETERFWPQWGLVAPAGQIPLPAPARLSVTDTNSSAFVPAPSSGLPHLLDERFAPTAEAPSVGSSSTSSPSASSVVLSTSISPVASTSALPVRRRSRRASDAHPPRPPNAFILFRSDQVRLFKSDPNIPAITQSKLSQLIAEKWRNESPRTKEWYKQYADLKKRDHASTYPGYRYVPRRERTEGSDGEGSAGTEAESSSSAFSSRRPSLIRGESSPTFSTFVGVPGNFPQPRSASISERARSRELALPGRLRHAPSNPNFSSTPSTSSSPTLYPTQPAYDSWRRDPDPLRLPPTLSTEQELLETYSAPFQLSPLSQELTLHDTPQPSDHQLHSVYYSHVDPAAMHGPVESGLPYTFNLRHPSPRHPLPDFDDHHLASSRAPAAYVDHQFYSSTPTYRQVISTPAYQAEDYASEPLYYGPPETFHPHSAPPTMSSFPRPWETQPEHGAAYEAYYSASAAYEQRQQPPGLSSNSNDSHALPQQRGGNALHVHLSDLHR